MSLSNCEQELCPIPSAKPAKDGKSFLAKLEPIVSYATPNLLAPQTVSTGYRASVYWLEHDLLHQATLVDISHSKAVVKFDDGSVIDADSPVLLSINHSRSNGPLTLKGTIHGSGHSEPDGRYEITFSEVSRRSQRFIYFLANYSCHAAIRNSNQFSVHRCDSLSSYREAYGLVYKEYLERGYCRSKASELHYTYFNLLPNSKTFLLKRSGTLLGTISLILDSPCGLPIEACYPRETAEMRKRGPLAEVGLLALDSALFSRGKFSLLDCEKFTALFRLLNLIFMSAYAKGVSLIIAVHPKHELLYKWLGFEVIGDVKSYESAAGAAALPMYLPANKRGVSGPSMELGPLDFLSMALVPDSVLENQGAIAAEIFEALFPQVQPGVPNAAMNYLHQLYPITAELSR